MAIYPKATVQLIPKWNKNRMKNYRRMNIHTAVSTRENIRDIFAAKNSGACSHFYVNFDGKVYQYIDTKYMSAADLNGSDSTISVETAGGTGSSSKLNAEKFNSKMMTALVELWTWARDTHNIKNQLAKDTSTIARSLGLSWHRLGVYGNFDGRKGISAVSLSSIKSGGIKYSKHAGKECPGDAKILQIPEIFERANGKEVKPPVASKPKPETTKPQSSKKGWPYKKVREDGKLNADWDEAWKELFKRMDIKGKSLTTQFQRWLKNLGYYKGIIEEDHGKTPVFGPYLIDALQRFMKDKGFYKGIFDAFKAKYSVARGSVLRKAEQKYLNYQIQFFIK